MARKTASTESNPETPIQVLKEGTCPTNSGKSTLGYQVGVDDTGEIQFKVISNSGGGFFSIEWIGWSKIQEALKDWPEDQHLTSFAFRSLYRGQSANNPGFLTAVLISNGILEPVPDKKRVFQACDPAPFLAEIRQLQQGGGESSVAMPR